MSITHMTAYSNHSFEELRTGDYAQGLKFKNSVISESTKGSSFMSNPFGKDTDFGFGLPELDSTKTEACSNSEKSLPGTIPQDQRFADARFVQFDQGKIKFESQNLNQIGFVKAIYPLSKDCPYFEAMILRDAEPNAGIAVGVTCRTFAAGSMVGNQIGSIGYHSNDGRLHSWMNDRFSSISVDFGPKSMAGDRIGCGIICSSNQASAIYFVRNGIEIGRVAVDSEMAFPFATISSSNGAIIAYDCRTSPPLPSLPACILKTSSVDVLDAVTGKWKTAKKVGKESSLGVPVMFEESDRLQYAKPDEVKASASPIPVEVEFPSLSEALE
eukprot:665682-Hanusia_phi.AAC.1